MEVVTGCVPMGFESGSKLRALHTLRAVRDRRVLLRPAVVEVRGKVSADSRRRLRGGSGALGFRKRQQAARTPYASRGAGRASALALPRWSRFAEKLAPTHVGG
ncbi:hypothetical protein SBV1_2970001 [Verrucomicrobia bacterium]|nr:hypothetical protein SBV1_2970001 [Verrucomicrobiota bacterium]